MVRGSGTSSHWVSACAYLWGEGSKLSRVTEEPPNPQRLHSTGLGQSWHRGEEQGSPQSALCSLKVDFIPFLPGTLSLRNREAVTPN